ncbi:membrane protein [Streptomyces phage Dryad]|nr:membrane protein [Streptomyces phage Dryad]
MLETLCYTAGFILLVLAAVLPATVPHRDRMAYAGLALWLLPTTVHALQA